MAVDKPFVGVDLGGTNMQIGVVDPDYTLLSTAKRKTKPEEGFDEVLARMLSGIDEACQEAGVPIAQLGGIGVGAPGAVDPEEGIVLEAVNLRWNDTPLAAILQKRLGLPTFLDNDVNVAVYGENRLGAGKKAENLLGVWLGTGVGGGLILNGKLYYGHFKTAGEFGHIILFPRGPLGWRSLEQNCSRTSVVERLVKLITANQPSMLPSLVGGDLDKIKSKTIGKAYQERDELTVEVIEEVAELLGGAIAGVVTLLSLPRVVLGGGLTEALGQPFVDLVEKSTRRMAFPDRCKEVDVVASRLEDNAGVYGAAMIAMERSG